MALPEPERQELAREVLPTLLLTPDCLAAAVKIPPAHAADLVAFVQASRATGDCEARYGGFCDAGGQTRMTFSSGDQTRRFRGYVERILKARVGRGGRNANRAVRLQVA